MSLPEIRVSRRQLLIGSTALLSACDRKESRSPKLEATRIPLPQMEPTKPPLPKITQEVIELGEGVWKTKIAENFMLPEGPIEKERKPLPSTMWSGDRLFTRGTGGKVLELDPRSGKPIWEFPGKSGVVLGASKERLLVATEDMKVFLVDPIAKREINTITPRIAGLPPNKLRLYFRWPAMLNENAIVIPRGETIEGTYNGFLACSLDGEFLWESSGNSHQKAIELIGKTFVVGAGNSILLQNIDTAEVLARIPADKTSETSWAYTAKDELIFVVGKSSYIFAKTFPGGESVMSYVLSIYDSSGVALGKYEFVAGWFDRTMDGRNVFCLNLCNLNFEPKYLADLSAENGKKMYILLRAKDNSRAIKFWVFIKDAEGKLVVDEEEDFTVTVSPLFYSFKDKILSLYTSDDRYAIYPSLPDRPVVRGQEQPSLTVTGLPGNPHGDFYLFNIEIPGVNFLGLSSDNLIFVNWNEEYSSKYEWGTPTIYALNKEGWLVWEPVEIKSNVMLRTIKRDNAIFLIGEAITRIDTTNGNVQPVVYIGSAPKHIIDTGESVFIETVDNQLIGFTPN